MESYRDLFVWKKGKQLTIAIYHLTEKFPSNELYGISGQMRRAALSIPSNIAEGRRRGTRNDFRHFLRIAYGSGAELETQIEIAKDLGFGQVNAYTEIEEMLDEIMRMLNRMIERLSEPHA